MRDVRIPMRDSVTLSADVYLPSKEKGRWPALVARTPYQKTSSVIFERSCKLAKRGFAVIYVDVRGRGDSDGVWVPYRNEARDGYDTIEWVAAQGTFGGSYLGRIQMLTAVLRPPHLKAMFVAVVPSDPFVEWPTGVSTPMHMCWLYMTSGRLVQNVDVIDWKAVYSHRPMCEAFRLTGKESAHWEMELGHNDGLDEWWEEICYQDKFSQIEVPILHISGWYDDEQCGTLINFIGMTTQAKEEVRSKQKLVMGPWPHALNTSQTFGDLDFGPESLIDMIDLQDKWFSRWLKGEQNDIMDPPVSIFVMGDNKWRAEQTWPLQRAQPTKFYFGSIKGANTRLGDGFLSTSVPTEGSGRESDTYTYDPNDPCPFLTEWTSAQIGGADDYSQVELRNDVLVYTSEVLKEDLEVTGPLLVTLFASSSAPDTDFTAKLLDVRPNGFAQRLADGMVRARFREGVRKDKMKLIVPHQVYKYTIDCWNTSHVFRKGHAIRVEISSSAFPKYDPNLNTGAPLGKTAEAQVAQQTIYHSAHYPSCITLPIVPRS